jgi:putative ABC transport system ATP-binding protein
VTTVLEANDVSMTFEHARAPVPVLRGVSLALEPGEVVVLEGPSGSGKTTLLSILGCMLTPSGGRVAIAGDPVDWDDPGRLPRLRRTRIGFVFQQFNLFPALTAFENVLFVLELKGARGAPARVEARALLDAVGLGGRAGFLPRDLSGGQKQRVAIARALAGAPSVVLADEPTASLDGESGAQVLDLLRAAADQGSRAVLVVTHDVRVRRIADRVLELRDGRLAGER